MIAVKSFSSLTESRPIWNWEEVVTRDTPSSVRTIAVDINLAKQLNTVMTQLGVNAQSIVMNIGSAAAGYGYEYVASTLDRVKDAALKQADAMLQMPIMTPVSADAWGVKEAVMSEADMPEWGNQEERGVEMEVTTAAAVLAGGSDAVIMRHPAAIRTIAKMINALM